MVYINLWLTNPSGLKEQHVCCYKFFMESKGCGDASGFWGVCLHSYSWTQADKAVGFCGWSHYGTFLGCGGEKLENQGHLISHTGSHTHLFCSYSLARIRYKHCLNSRRPGNIGEELSIWQASQSLPQSCHMEMKSISL